MFARSRAAQVAKRNWRRLAVTGAATMGVVVLSAGTGYTAAQITSADIRNQTIQSHDIGAEEVGASELRGNAVRQAHIARGGVDHTEIADGGIRSRDLGGGLREEIMERDFPTLRLFQVDDRWEQGTNRTLVHCPKGQVAITGGYDAGADGDGLRAVRQSAPLIQSAAGPPIGWRVIGDYDGPGYADVTVYVACSLWY